MVTMAWVASASRTLAQEVLMNACDGGVARPLAPVNVPVEWAEPFLLVAVDVLCPGNARRGARFDEGPAERIFHFVADRGQWTAAAAPEVFA